MLYIVDTPDLPYSSLLGAVRCNGKVWKHENSPLQYADLEMLLVTGMAAAAMDLTLSSLQSKAWQLLVHCQLPTSYKCVHLQYAELEQTAGSPVRFRHLPS